MIYHAHIVEHEARDGRFVTSLGGIVVESRDPEHDLCHAITQAGLPDGPIQFWRNGMQTLFHPSVHRMGRMRMKLGNRFPYQRVRREEGEQIVARTSPGDAQTGETELSAIGVANTP